MEAPDLEQAEAIIILAQALVEEARALLEERVSFRNGVFEQAARRGWKPTQLARLTGMTRQAVSKAIEDARRR